MIVSKKLRSQLLEFICKLWPKVLFSKRRKKFKDALRIVSVLDRKADGVREGVRPWAFIRVKNERKLLLASLNSILPVIDKGVIGYNECTDGSEEIILEFCKKNKGFVPFKYPYKVERASSMKYATGELKEENTLAGYYNAVLSLIPKGEWIIKIDVDQIYIPSILKHSFTLPTNKKDVVIYSRINSVRDADGNIKVCGYVRPGDHWLICNIGLNFVNVFGNDDKGKFFAYEHLSLSGRNIPYKPECSSVHFPFEKECRIFTGNTESLIDFDDFIRNSNKLEISDELLRVKDIMKNI